MAADSDNAERTLRQRIDGLESMLRARDTTIRSLMDAAERSANREPNHVPGFRESAGLEKLVRSKTRELEESNSELARTLAQLKEAQAELMHTSKLTAIGQLSAGVAHEINTPIQFVGDSVAFLKEGVATLAHFAVEARRLLDAVRDDEKYTAMLANLEREAPLDDLDFLVEETPLAADRALDGVARVAKIVRALKEFAHPDRSEKVEADINHLLTTTLTIARNEYRYVAEVETSFADLPPVPCLSGELNQVFVNLLVNAAHAIQDKYRNEGQRGRICVKTSLESQCVLVTVSDDGCGIPASIIERIYDPFFTTKEVGRGTGQGLASARSIIVGKHGGTINVSSEPGRGTTFFIRLPLAPAVAQDAMNPAEAA